MGGERRRDGGKGGRGGKGGKGWPAPLSQISGSAPDTGVVDTLKPNCDNGTQSVTAPLIQIRPTRSVRLSCGIIQAQFQ